MRAAVETRVEFSESGGRTRIVVAPITDRQMLIFMQYEEVQMLSLYISRGQAKEILARLEVWLRPFVFQENVAANG